MVEIEIAYGTAEKQLLETMQVEEGTTTRQAVLQSRIAAEFPDADVEKAPLGIFGKAVKDDTVLRDKDRVEVYRPLLIDPKEARRLRVQSKNEEA
ncbi:MULTISPECIES: RnfH family protein [unclassified Neisseria]|uniref:RnfH family protein n=1 Tax=unclassified Neisseria TaxID=2623750 RepID=UPI002666FFD5|nr:MULTISPECIES: RnfH family protein [unclassified Neisseria]MDO1508863.1 RnfH family protein [Neisseria sp. MVDL19-042950]MDO1515122.1 RnfH family protein [Neisseria sp. MVDL18-041461]MDO1562482.1 RnfH family protein [Neisseria sp. MVDL20-010259]